MAFIPIPNTAQVRMQFVYGGQQVENVYYVEKAAPWNASDLNALAAVFLNWWNANIQPTAPNTLSLERILARDMTIGTSFGIEYTAGLPIVGANNNQQLPNNVTLAVKWNTGLVGRSFRGRTYHLGLTEAQVAINTVDATHRGVLLDAYNQLLLDVDGGAFSGQMVVASLYSGVDGDGNPIPRATGVTTVILNAFINATIDSQRRRLPERGS